MWAVAVKEVMVPQFVPKNKPYLEASWVPKEENRIVSMVRVFQVCNQLGVCCGAQGNP